MRNLVYYVACSVDGYIARPDGGFDAFPVEGDHFSVLLTEFADALPVGALSGLGITPPGTRFDTVLMGWNTLAPALDSGVTSPYPHLRQFVASRHGRQVDPSLTLTDDPMDTVRGLKQQSGADIWLCGGGQLAGTLLPEIDRVIVKRNPIVFGSGIPMFGNAAYEPRAFILERTRSFGSGVTIEEYRADRPDPD